MSSSSLLFTPLKVGKMTLQHRLALAPLTRFRADSAHVHSDIAITYYEQRASAPGTLLITEGTFISEEAGGYSNVPGIYTDAQIKAWKKITDAVHAKGSYIYLQIANIGRAAQSDELAKTGHHVVSASDIPLADNAVPTPLTKEDIQRHLASYAQAAKNAVEAGFDGVEIHGANGYLVDQFLQDVSNNRTDEYGGSIENRSRFALEVINAVVKSIGEDRTGIRLSPWNDFQEMRMADPIPQFTHLISSIRTLYPSFAYIHLVEPTINGTVDRVAPEGASNAFARELWKGRPFLSAGGYTAETAKESVGKTGDVIVFGRWFISNPDLPLRIKNNIPFARYQRETFYVPGPDKAEGYIDYPTSAEEQANTKL